MNLNVMHKVLAKLHIHDYFLPIFCIKNVKMLLIYIVKTIQYKEINNKHILKTLLPISFEQKLYWSVYLA